MTQNNANRPVGDYSWGVKVGGGILVWFLKNRPLFH